MLADHLPILRLRLRTERLELRLPADFDEVAALADTAAAGVHDPDLMPFRYPWSEGTPAERARSVAMHHSAIGPWDANDWGCNFFVFYEGKPIGIQGLDGKDVAITREVASGSWIGQAYQGRGIGTEMRAAVLHFAFAELGAEYAKSASFDDNDASAGVSRKLGYRPDGIEYAVVQRKRRLEHRWRLSREDWDTNRKHEVRIDGLDQDVLDMLGLKEADA